MLIGDDGVDNEDTIAGESFGFCDSNGRLSETVIAKRIAAALVWHRVMNVMKMLDRRILGKATWKQHAGQRAFSN